MGKSSKPRGGGRPELHQDLSPLLDIGTFWEQSQEENLACYNHSMVSSKTRVHENYKAPFKYEALLFNECLGKKKMKTRVTIRSEEIFVKYRYYIYSK